MPCGGGIPRSDYGVLGDEILWPPGFLQIKRCRGSGAHGNTWLLRNDAVAQKVELEAFKTKLEEGIVKLNLGIDQAEQDIHENEVEDDDANYDDEADYAERFDPHDRADAEVLLEERQDLKTELEDHLEEIKSRLDELDKKKLNFTWDRKDLPFALRRLDKPWEDFDREAFLSAKAEADAQAALQAQQLEDARKKALRKGKQFQEPPKLKKLRDIPKMYCAKLLEGPGAVVGDGRTFHFSDAKRDDSGSKELIMEVKLLMKAMWRFIVEYGKFNFEVVGLAPVVHVDAVKKTHKRYKSISAAAIIMPYFASGSVAEKLKCFSSKPHTYFFKDDLLLFNMNQLIKCLGYMEWMGHYHGNIHAENVLVSDDGFRLLISDFLPPSVFKSWINQIAKGLSSVPSYCSPEYRQHLVNERTRNIDKFSRLSRVNKHDVYCLGLVFYYIFTLQNPTELHKTPGKAESVLNKMKKHGRNSELIDSILTMLAPVESRKTFLQLVPSSTRVGIEMTRVARGVGGILGLAGPNPEELYLEPEMTPLEFKPEGQTQPKNERKQKQKQEEGYCSVM